MSLGFSETALISAGAKVSMLKEACWRFCAAVGGWASRSLSYSLPPMAWNFILRMTGSPSSSCVVIGNSSTRLGLRISESKVATCSLTALAAISSTVPFCLPLSRLPSSCSVTSMCPSWLESLSLEL